MSAMPLAMGGPAPASAETADPLRGETRAERRIESHRAHRQLERVRRQADTRALREVERAIRLDILPLAVRSGLPETGERQERATTPVRRERPVRLPSTVENPGPLPSFESSGFVLSLVERAAEALRDGRHDQARSDLSLARSSLAAAPQAGRAALEERIDRLEAQQGW